MGYIDVTQLNTTSILLKVGTKQNNNFYLQFLKTGTGNEYSTEELIIEMETKESIHTGSVSRNWKLFLNSLLQKKGPKTMLSLRLQHSLGVKHEINLRR